MIEIHKPKIIPVQIEQDVFVAEFNPELNMILYSELLNNKYYKEIKERAIAHELEHSEKPYDYIHHTFVEFRECKYLLLNPDYASKFEKFLDDSEELLYQNNTLHMITHKEIFGRIIYFIFNTFIFEMFLRFPARIRAKLYDWRVKHNA